MDLETLFYVAIAVLYLLSRVVGSRRKQAQKQGAPPRPPRPQRPPAPRAEPSAAERSPELDEALREIRRALGWEQPEPVRPREPAPSPEPATTFEPAVAREPERVPPSRPIPRTTVEKADRRPVPQAPGESARPRVIPRARLESSARKDEFRSLETTQWDAVAATPRQTIAAPAASRSAQTEEERILRARELRRKLLDPASARESFLIAEIFAPRRRRL